MAIAGLRGTGDWGTDERPKNFREGILRFNPNGTAPIFALTSKASTRTTDDPEFSWWCEGNNIIRLAVNGNPTATDTTITVSGIDPSVTNLGAPYGDARNLKDGDILMVDPLVEPAGSVAFAPEYIEVDDVLSATQFTVRRGALGSTPASIASGQGLTIVGSGYAEGTGVPRATFRNPTKYTNKIQIFKDTYELTGTADKTKTRTNNNYSEDKKRKIFKQSADIEFAFMFGKQSETIGDNGKPKRTMDGLRNFIPLSNQFVYSAPVTPADFLDKLAPVFDFDTGAGDTRMGFFGNKALIELSKIFANEVIFNVNNVVKVYGMDFQEFILPNGRVLLRSHPLLSRHGLYQKSGFILDFDAIKCVEMSGRPNGTPKDDVQTEDEDVRRGFIQTDTSLEVDYGGLTMAYLGNISAT